jgi:hypothetical protein
MSLAVAQTDSYPVLCIEERDDDNYEIIVNRLFIAYDSEYNTYVVYGKNQNLKDDDDFVPYFFRADKSIHMFEFVKLLVNTSPCSFTMYNYNNISVDLEQSDYYLMEKNMDKNYDMVSYDTTQIEKKRFRKLMHTLKYIYNVY